MTHHWSLHFLLGAFVVWIVASRRFNTPSWCRSYTTAARYRCMSALYALSQVFICYVLSATLYAASSGGEQSSDILLPAVLPAVLITIWLVPMIPKFEAWLRLSLQRLAGIGDEAAWLRRMLLGADFSASKDVEAQVKSLLVRRGFDPDQNWFPPAEPTQALWLKAATVFHGLRTWESERGLGGFIVESRNEFDALRQRFDQLSLKVSRTFGNIERFGSMMYRLSQSAGDVVHRDNSPLPGNSDASDIRVTLRKSIENTLDGLREDIASFLNDTCLLIARAVLSCESTESQRMSRLQDLGFRVQAREMRPVNVLLYAFAAVAACMVTAFAVLGTGTSGGTRLGATAIRIVMIATIQVTALLVAIIPKTLWGFANPGISERTPITFVVGAGAVAAFLSVPVGLAFRLLMFRGWHAAWTDFASTYPWVMMAFTTAAVTACLIQDHRWASTRSRARAQQKDAAVMGIAMSVSIYLVQLWLWRVHGPNFLGDMEGVIGMGVFAFLMGASIGYVVPASFRESRRLPSGEDLRRRTVVPRLSDVGLTEQWSGLDVRR
jgi:hypothetical protein